MSEHNYDQSRGERERIREELESSGQADLARVALSLEKQAVEEDPPPMPESLEAKIREKFGAKPEAPAAEAKENGFGAFLIGLFKRPLVSGGLLAAAACVVLGLAVFNPGGLVVRGGGGDGGDGAVVIVVGGGAIDGVDASAMMVVEDAAGGEAAIADNRERARIVVLVGERSVAGYGVGDVEAQFRIAYGAEMSLLEAIAEAEGRLEAGD